MSKLMTKYKLLLFGLLLLGITYFIWVYGCGVELLGHRIPNKNIRLDYIIGLWWAVFLGLSILIWPVHSSDKKALLWIWVIKCFVMLGFMLLYEYYYQIDSFLYFIDARIDMSQWHVKYCDGPNFPPIFLTGLHQNLLLDSYHAVKISFGFIGMIGIYIFYRAIVVFLQEEKLKLLYVFAFFPSILFWSSTLGKDPLVFFAITVYCYGVVKWVRKRSWLSVVILLAGLISVASIRPWMGAILAFPVFVVTVFGMSGKYLLKRSTLLGALILVTLISANNAFTYLGVNSGRGLTSVANERFNGFSRGGSVDKTEAASDLSSQGSVADYKIKFKSKLEMALFVPRGMFTALFRPMPGEVKNSFGFLAGLEGAFMLILFIFALKRIVWKDLLDPILIWAILLILIWAGAYSFVSYNLGTICRYRIQILPIFLGLLLHIILRNDKSGKLTMKER